MPAITKETDNRPSLPLRSVSILAWCMMVAGALAEVPTLRNLPAVASHAASAEDTFLAICVVTAVMVLGYGLRSRRPWAWEGTINLAGILVLVGGLIPLAMIDARKDVPTIVGAFCRSGHHHIAGAAICPRRFRVDKFLRVAGTNDLDPPHRNGRFRCGAVRDCRHAEFQAATPVRLCNYWRPADLVSGWLRGISRIRWAGSLPAGLFSTKLGDRMLRIFRG